FLLGQPHAPDAVRGALGGDAYVVGRVHGLPVGAAAAVRDPGPGAGAHHRLERGHQAARGALDLNDVVAVHVDVGLAVGDNQDFLALQVVSQDRPQRLGRPVDLGLFPRRAFRFELPYQCADVLRHRPQLRNAHLRLADPEGLAADHRFQARDPAAPAHFGDYDRYQRDDR